MTDGKRLAALDLEGIAARMSHTLATLGVTASELARECEVSQSSVSRIISGERPISAPLLQAMAYVYGVNPAWVLTGAGPISLGELEAEHLAKVPSEDLRAELARRKDSFAHLDEVVNFIRVWQRVTGVDLTRGDAEVPDEVAESGLEVAARRAAKGREATRRERGAG